MFWILLANLGEVVIFFALFHFSMSIELAAFFALGHGGSIYLFSRGLALQWKDSQSSSLSILALAITLPLAIPFLSLISFMASRNKGERDILDFFSGYIAFQPPNTPLRLSQEYVEEEIQIESLIDIVFYEKDLGLCRDAITKLGRARSAMTVKVLREALNHKIPEIRLYAFHEISDIEQELTQKLNGALSLTERAPRAPESWQSLGNSYWAYCELKILDEESHKQYLLLAEKAYRQAFELAPNEGIFSFFLGRALVELENFPEAQKYLEEAKAKLYEPILCLEWLAKIFFAQRKFKTLKKLVREIYLLDPERKDWAWIYDQWLPEFTYEEKDA